ncbi:MAG: hypothetical protein CR965_00430 [Paludibacter sp.]|nr:MAG: hypothetical protein CR965_00430 [Paludibacter sp.]
MTPKFKAQAGTFESSDIMVLIEPVEGETGRQVDVDSTVMLQYGARVETAIKRSLGIQEGTL